MVLSALAHVMPFCAYPYVGEAIVCNLCGSTNTVPICETDRRWKKLRTVACSDCGLMRTDPMPTAEELDAYYQQEYRRDYQGARGAPPKFHLTRSWREARERAGILRDYLTPGVRVLDVGCGTGEFLKIAADAGCQSLGIEPSDIYASYARRAHKIDVVNAPWRSCTLPPGAFDLIVCREVLEHLRDPVDAIEAMARWLKPDGAMYLTVPDMRANDKPSFERFHFAHVYGFTPETLAAACAKAGLVPDAPMTSTKAVFRKASQVEASVVRDPARAQQLVADYPPASVLRYVVSGEHFRAAGRRFRKWSADTKSASRQIAASKVPVSEVGQVAKPTPTEVGNVALASDPLDAAKSTSGPDVTRAA